MDNHKGKILITHIFPILLEGGVPTVLLNLISSTKTKYNHNVISKTLKNDLTARYATEVNSLVDLDVNRPSLKTVFQVFFQIKKSNTAVIHTHGKSGLFYGFFLSLLTRNKVRFVHTFHGFHLPENRVLRMGQLCIYKYYNNVCHIQIAVSESEKRSLLQYLNFKNIIVIHNGVIPQNQEDNFDILKITNKYKKNIVSFSRINKQKNLKLMIEVFDDVYTEGMSLHIIGGYDEKDIYYKNIRNLIEKLRSKKHIYIWGNIYNAPRFLHYFQFYVSTSIFEGLPTAIIEAFLAKVPVIATPCSGNIDLVNDKTGYLAKSLSEGDFYEKFIEALNDSSTNIKLITEKAYELALNFSVDNYVKCVIKHYD